MKDKNDSKRTLGRREVIKGAATAGLITATGMQPLVYAGETKPARRDMIRRENAKPPRHGVTQQGPDQRVQQITRNLFQRIIS